MRSPSTVKFIQSCCRTRTDACSSTCLVSIIPLVHYYCSPRQESISRRLHQKEPPRMRLFLFHYNIDRLARPGPHRTSGCAMAPAASDLPRTRSLSSLCNQLSASHSAIKTWLIARFPKQKHWLADPYTPQCLASICLASPAPAKQIVALHAVSAPAMDHNGRR